MMQVMLDGMASTDFHSMRSDLLCTTLQSLMRERLKYLAIVHSDATKITSIRFHSIHARKSIRMDSSIGFESRAYILLYCQPCNLCYSKGPKVQHTNKSITV